MSSISPDKPADDKTGRLVADPPGAYMLPKYVGLEMTVYPIDESRLESLSMLNNGAAFFFSVGTGAIMFAIGLAKDLSFVSKEHIPAGASDMASVVYWLCGVGAFITYTVASLLLWKRGGIIKQIKQKAIKQ